jgi:hypothetical protein
LKIQAKVKRFDKFSASSGQIKKHAENVNEIHVRRFADAG